MSIGERIKYLRERNGMTLESVAKHLGIGRSTVFRYENGTVTNIPSDKIEMLARLFNVSPAYILCWSDEENPQIVAERRIPVIIPNTEAFIKLTHYMPEEDYQMVMKAFEKAAKRMREVEGGES